MHKEATLDIDATLAETTKKEALFGYDGYRAYQPKTSYWAETSLAVISEFRDCNVPAGHDMLRRVKESLAALRLLALPGGLKKKRLKAIRFALIDTPARLVEYSRQLFIRLGPGNLALEWLSEMRRLIHGRFHLPPEQTMIGSQRSNGNKHRPKQC